jgi:hypothetical protein
MKVLSIGLLLLAASLRAQDFEHPRTLKKTWVRRATLVASCAASLAFDSLTTRRAVAAGGVESNPVLADAQGHPQWGRIIGLKAGLCGFTAAIEETHVFGTWKSPNADWTWTGINAGTAAAYTFAGFHNLKIATDLAK